MATDPVGAVHALVGGLQAHAPDVALRGRGKGGGHGQRCRPGGTSRSRPPYGSCRTRSRPPSPPRDRALPRPSSASCVARGRRVLGRPAPGEGSHPGIGGQRPHRRQGVGVQVAAGAALPCVAHGAARVARGRRVAQHEPGRVVAGRLGEVGDLGGGQPRRLRQRHVADRAVPPRRQVRRRLVGVAHEARVGGGGSHVHAQGVGSLPAVTGRARGRRVAGRRHLGDVLLVGERQVRGRPLRRGPGHLRLQRAVVAGRAVGRRGVVGRLGARLDAGVAPLAEGEETLVLLVGEGVGADGVGRRRHARGGRGAREDRRGRRKQERRQQGHVAPAEVHGAILPPGMPGSGPTVHSARSEPRSWLQSSSGAPLLV